MDEVKLPPCEAIARMQRQLDCGNGLIEGREPPMIRVLVSDLRAAIEATRPPIVTDEVVERVAREQFDWQHGTALTWESRPAHERNARIKQARHWCDLPTISAAIAAMPTIDQDGGEA